MKKILFKFIPIFSLLTFIPSTAFAASRCISVNGVSGLACRLNEIFYFVIPVLVALGVVYFIWGVVQYFIGDSEEAKKKGRDRIIFGLIGLVVIVSIWGLVAILADSFGIGPGSGSNEATSAEYLNKLLPQ